MTASEQTAAKGFEPLMQRLTQSPVVVRLRRILQLVAASHWTPVAVSILSIVAILAAAGGVVLQQRLFEIAEARLTATTEQDVPVGQLAESVEFTLAPEAVRDISMDEARAFNAALPFSSLPILAARPFIMATDDIENYTRALDCLTAAVYFEAASETAAGQAAVAQVVLNRMRHPAFPKTVCGVVFQGEERSTGCQFSFTCDGAVARVPSALGWARARATASSALNGWVSSEVGMATHYHTDWVAPYWAERLVKMHQIGTHIFYRWTGGWGLPGAFRGTYAGHEPVIGKMAMHSSPTTTPEPIIVLPVEEIILPPADVAPLVIETERSPGETFVAPPVAEPVVVEAPPQPVAGPPILANPLDRQTAPTQNRRRIPVAR